MLGQFSPGEPYCSLPTTTAGKQSFHFRTRTEPIDWRRLAFLDVDHVAQGMDVSMLQDFIMTVTFCDVVGERCPKCCGPIDPSLIKMVRMSQLSTEYLLHCQEYLSTQLLGLEERLQGALFQARQEREQREELDKKMKEMKLKRHCSKKTVATQQLYLQANVNNYHKCQLCEKLFVNYSYLQAHIQRRHHEITDAGENKRQVEQMKYKIEELKERLQVTQMQLQSERETDSLRRQQEQEEQSRREQLEKETLERWKEMERRQFQQEIGELRQLILQDSKDMASKSLSIEANLLELQNREFGAFTNVSLQDERDRNKERIENRERKLKKRMIQKKNEWSKKLQEVQNRHKQDKEELQSENARLLQALSVKQNSDSNLQRLQQQFVSLSSWQKQKDTDITSLEEKIKKLSAMPVSDPIVSQKTQASHKEKEEEDEKSQLCICRSALENPGEAQWNIVVPLIGNPELVREFRTILEESLEEKLENMGLWKGTKGISKQMFKSLNALLTNQQLQKSRQHPYLDNLRETLSHEVTKQMKGLQKRWIKSSPSTSKNSKLMGVKKNPTQVEAKRLKIQDPVKEKSSSVKEKRSSKGSKPSTQGVKIQQSETFMPTPSLRSKAPTQIQTSPTQQKSSTSPFSSEDDRSIEDSAYISSSHGKPFPSVRLVQSGSLLNPTADPEGSDSELSETDTPKHHKAPSTNCSVVQTPTVSLESTPVRKPMGGTRILPPASNPSSRRTIVKQRALSDGECDLELSSIEELTAPPAGVQRW